MVKDHIKKEDYSLLVGLLNKIEKEPTSGAFIDPVDWKAMNLLDYPKIVTRPMELSTIRNNLK